MTVYSFVDESGETRLRGTIDPVPGGFTPVSVYLQLRNTTLNIHAAGAHGPYWDTIYDNPWDANVLGALPAGIGLTAPLFPDPGTITTTELGVWAFTIQASFAADSAWKGQLILDTNTSVAAMAPTVATVGGALSATEIVPYPAGATFDPIIQTLVQSTADPYESAPSMIIVRLA